MVHRDIEEALHLLRVQIHREHAAHPGGMKEIRHELGGDRNARLILPVLSCVTKKRNDGGDAIGTGAARRIDHDEQLHEMLVGWRTSRLNDENITAANILLDLDISFAIGE